MRQPGGPVRGRPSLGVLSVRVRACAAHDVNLAPNVGSPRTVRRFTPASVDAGPGPPATYEGRHIIAQRNLTDHEHRPVQSRVEAGFWCVTPARCAARPDRQAAHGGVVTIEVCRCGAERWTETNAGVENRSPWWL